MEEKCLNSLEGTVMGLKLASYVRKSRHRSFLLNSTDSVVFEEACMGSRQGIKCSRADHISVGVN